MNEYEMAFTAGGIFSLVWFLLYILCWVAHGIWAWIDDAEISSDNFMIYKGMEILGYSLDNEDNGFRYYKGESYYRTKIKSDGVKIMLVPMTIFVITPFITLISIQFYNVSLVIGTVLGIFYLARFARRNKKMFDTHTKDKNAHS